MIAMRVYRWTFMGVIALAACGLESTKEHESEDKTWTYSYEYNGCKTGKHTFKSKEAYCDGLTNDDLNNGCASEMRQKTAERECSPSS